MALPQKVVFPVVYEDRSIGEFVLSGKSVLELQRGENLLVQITFTYVDGVYQFFTGTLKDELDRLVLYQDEKYSAFVTYSCLLSAADDEERFQNRIFYTAIDHGNILCKHDKALHRTMAEVCEYVNNLFLSSNN